MTSDLFTVCGCSQQAENVVVYGLFDNYSQAVKQISILLPLIRNGQITDKQKDTVAYINLLQNSKTIGSFW